MSIPLTVTEILRDHVTLEVESLDRMYLNVYVPHLQHERGVVAFFRYQPEQTFASSALMAPMSQAFVTAINTFVKAHQISLITFPKGPRKDDLVAKHLARFQSEEGVLFVGKAQEKISTFRTEKRRNPDTGRPYPWIVRSPGLVNQYYLAHSVNQGVPESPRVRPTRLCPGGGHCV